MPVGLEKKLERRASVLATARRLIAERGYAGVTIRDLADACGVSVGTLYNRFESKDHLLAAAVEELFRAQITAVQRRPGCRGLARVLATAQVAVDCIDEDPNYRRAIVKGLRTSSATAELVQTLSGGFHSLYVQGLGELREQGELVPWADVHIVAEALFAVVGDSNRRWVDGNHTAAWLRRRTVYNACLVLLGITRGAARDELETRLGNEPVEPAAGAVSAAS